MINDHNVTYALFLSEIPSSALNASQSTSRLACLKSVRYTLILSASAILEIKVGRRYNAMILRGI